MGIRYVRLFHQCSKANRVLIISAFTIVLVNSEVVLICCLLQALILPKITAENTQRNKYKHTNVEV